MSIKQDFETFCKTYYPKKKFDSTTGNGNWFHLQAGNYFSTYIHYEYRVSKKEIHFHLEFDEEANNIKFYDYLPLFVRDKLEKTSDNSKATHYRWYHLKNSEKKDKLTKLSEDEEKSNENIKIFEETFKELIDLIEPCIELMEKVALTKSINNLIDEYNYL